MIVGDGGPNELWSGNGGPAAMHGLGGDDRLDIEAGDAGDGDDLVIVEHFPERDADPRYGRATVPTGAGDDVVPAAVGYFSDDEPEPDDIACGEGVDTVEPDPEDLVAADCRP